LTLFKNIINKHGFGDINNEWNNWIL
jgi:hypothetical protein